MSKRKREDEQDVLSGLGSDFFSGSSSGRSRLGPSAKKFRGFGGIPKPAGLGDDEGKASLLQFVILTIWSFSVCL